MGNIGFVQEEDDPDQEDDQEADINNQKFNVDTKIESRQS